MWCTLHETHGVVLTIFRVIHVHFETDLHLLGLLILLHLLDHRNLSPHAPGDLGNLIDDLQLRNLHDFLQSGCSTHLRLHFRVVEACVWLMNLFPLHNWYVNYSFSELPLFSVPFCVVGTCIKFQEFLPRASSAFWTFRVGVDLAIRHDSPVDELVFVQHVRNPHRRHLPLLHLINLHVFRALDVPMNCSSGISNLVNFFFLLLAQVVDFCPGWSDSLSLHFYLDDLDLHSIFDLLVHLGPFLSGGMNAFSASSS